MTSPHRTWTRLLLAAAIALAPAAIPRGEVVEESEEAVEADREGGAGRSGGTAGRARSGSGEAPSRAPGEPEVVVVEESLPYLPTSNSIATRLPAPLRFIPAHVGTVGEALLRDQRAFVLGDALWNVSGVNVHTQTGVADYFLIRGFDSLSSGLVLTDGASEPEVTFYHAYNVDRVEVFKGPGGFLYGSDPLAGAVNIVRRQPVPATFGRAGVSVGSFGTREASVDWNVASAGGGTAFRLNALGRSSDLFRDDKEADVRAVNPAFTWRVGPRSSLNVNLEFVDVEHAPDAGLPIFEGEIPDVRRTTSYQSPFDASEQRIGRAQVDLEVRLSPRWTIRNKTYLRGLDWETRGTLLTGVAPDFFTGRPTVFRSLLTLDDRQTFAGNRFEGILTASAGPTKHTLAAGIEVQRFADRYRISAGSLPGIDLFDPRETATSPPAPIPGAVSPDRGDSRSLVVAPYAIDTIEIGGRFRALVGARWDAIDFEDEESLRPRNDAELSPLAGVLWAAPGGVSLYASGARSFAPPSNRVAGDRVPEESEQVEVGAKLYRMDGKVQATVAAYRLERENIAIPDDNGFTQQAGDQRSRGIEVEVAAEPAPGLNAFVSYAYNDAELTRFTERVVVGVDPQTFQPIFATVDRTGNVPAFAPDHIASLWISKRFGGKIGVAGGGRYVSSQFIAEDNEYRIDGYAVLDAAVFGSIAGWDLSLNFRNLTGREHETRGFGSTSVIPAAPFEVYGGVQYRF